MGMAGRERRQEPSSCSRDKNQIRLVALPFGYVKIRTNAYYLLEENVIRFQFSSPATFSMETRAFQEDERWSASIPAHSAPG